MLHVQMKRKIGKKYFRVRKVAQSKLNGGNTWAVLLVRYAGYNRLEETRTPAVRPQNKKITNNERGLSPMDSMFQGRREEEVSSP